MGKLTNASIWARHNNLGKAMGVLFKRMQEFKHSGWVQVYDTFHARQKCVAFSLEYDLRS